MLYFGKKRFFVLMTALIKDSIEVVLYHGSCLDGFAAATSVYMYFQQPHLKWRREKCVVYKACYHSAEDPPEQFFDSLVGKHILMTDFSMRPNHIARILKNSASFMIHDHHETSEHFLVDVPDHLKIFNSELSGVGITWNWLFPDTELPKFFQYIQDHDLWLKKKPYSDAFATFFSKQPYDFELWLTFLSDDVFDKAIKTGQEWLGYKNILVNKTAKQGTCVVQQFQDVCLIIAYVCANDHKSDVANALLERFPYADLAVVSDYNYISGKTLFTLRSTEERQKCNLIAEKFGGGGHLYASGCAVDGAVSFLPLPILMSSKDTFHFIRKLESKTISCETAISLLSRKKIGKVYIA